MPLVDFFPRDFAEMVKKVEKVSPNPRETEAFVGEVERMMQVRSSRQPMAMAVYTVNQRVTKLTAFGRAGWARDPKNPADAILVDPQGCVITDLNGNPIPPIIGAIVQMTAPNTTQSIKQSFIPRVTSAEGAITHIYLDTENNPTIGIGHKIEGEPDLRAIHGKYGFYKHDTSGRSASILASVVEVIADMHNVKHSGVTGAASKFKPFTSSEATTGCTSTAEGRRHRSETQGNSRQSATTAQFPDLPTGRPARDSRPRIQSGHRKCHTYCALR